MMISKQLVLGGILALGGGVSLFALTQNNNSTTQTQVTTEKTMTTKTEQSDVARPSVGVLTADAKTESQLLEDKRRQREADVKEQERQVQTLLLQQEKAEADALKKAQAELGTKQTIIDDSAPATPKVQVRPEIIKAQQEAAQAKAQQATEKEAQKKAETAKKAEAEQVKKPTQPNDTKEPVKTQAKPVKGQHTVKQGDTLIKLSHQYDIPVSVIASANNMGRNDALAVGKTIKIPSKSEAQKIAKANEAKKQDDKPKADTKQAKSDTKKSNKVPTHYSVQVALVAKDKADAVAKQYRQAGYKVQTSQTSRGVRVLVGSAKTEAEANTLKNKIVKDSRVKTNGAWVKQVDEINAP